MEKSRIRDKHPGSATLLIVNNGGATIVNNGGATIVNNTS
jgi:hypothetical protein